MTLRNNLKLKGTFWTPQCHNEIILKMFGCHVEKNLIKLELEYFYQLFWSMETVYLLNLNKLKMNE